MKSAAISAAFLLGYGVGRILCAALKDVFQSGPVLGRTSIAEQLNGHCRNRQQEGDQDCGEVRNGAVVSPDWGLDVPNFLHEITKGDRIVLESMSKVVDLRDRPSPSLVSALLD
jgi:hypothetical protein